VQLPDSLAIFLHTRNTSIIYQESAVLGLGYYAENYFGLHETIISGKE
jgi:hypothetical protein